VSAPVEGPRRSSARLFLRYAGRAFGVLAFLLWLVPVVAAQTNATHVGKTGTSVPASGDFYLSNYSSTELICYLTPDNGASRTVVLEPIRSIWRFRGLLGTKVDRWFDGPALIGCDPSPPTARMNSGAVVALFPLAQGIELPIAALILVAVGWGDYFLPWRRRSTTIRRNR
jgi:hypothetical protein